MLVLERPLAFGRWLESLVYAKGYTVTSFAEAIGMSHPAVSSWINHGKTPKRPTCFKIAAALKVEPEIVLAAAGHPLDPDEPEPPAVQYFDAETMTDTEGDEDAVSAGMTG